MRKSNNIKKEMEEYIEMLSDFNGSKNIKRFKIARPDIIQNFQDIINNKKLMTKQSQNNYIHTFAKCERYV